MTPGDTPTPQPKPKSHELKPGMVLVHRSGSVLIISHRKPSGDGWWMTDDGAGLADFAYDSDDWLALTPELARSLFGASGEDEHPRHEQRLAERVWALADRLEGYEGGDEWDITALRAAAVLLRNLPSDGVVG